MSIYSKLIAKIRNRVRGGPNGENREGQSNGETKWTCCNGQSAIPDVEQVSDTHLNVRFSARDVNYSMSVVKKKKKKKKKKTTIGKTNEFIIPVKCRKRDDHMEC